MKISIITATYNCADTIEGCIASVTRQSHTNREHIAIDGASTDRTPEILWTHCERFSTLVSEPDGGIYDALNKGIARATGDVIGFLHADDFYAHEHVLAQIAQAFENPNVDAVYGDLVYVRKDQPGQVLRHWRSGPYQKGQLAWGWMPPHPTLYVRRELYQRHGGFDTGYRIAADYDCMLRLLSQMQGEVAYIPETLVHMRTGGASNRSLGNILRKSSEDYRALRHNRIGGASALAWKNLSKLPQFLRRP